MSCLTQSSGHDCSQVVEEELEGEAEANLSADGTPDAAPAAQLGVTDPADTPQADAPQATDFVSTGVKEGEAEQAAPQGPAKSTRTVTRLVPPPPPSKQVQIGRIAQEKLLDGELLADEHVVALVVEAVRQLEATYVASQAAQDGTAAAGDSPVSQVRRSSRCNS